MGILPGGGAGEIGDRRWKGNCRSGNRGVAGRRGEASGRRGRCGEVRSVVGAGQLVLEERDRYGGPVGVSPKLWGGTEGRG